MTIAQYLRSSLIAGAIVALSSGIGAAGFSYFVPDRVVTRVIDTQVKRYDDRDKYLIFTDDGVFENTDAWYRGKFRSSDLQRDAMKLKGKKSEIQKYGWRFGPFSWYENVLSIEPAE